MSGNADKKPDEISLIEIIQYIQKTYKYLLSKWLIICIFGIGGGLIGLGVSFFIKPTYTAHLSFSLVEKASGGGLADLASSFGFGGLIGSNSNGAFSGDNLLEILKSRYAIEQTLLTPINYKGNTENLIEVYIQSYDLRKKWLKDKKKELREIKFPVNQKRNTFSRTQDSILFVIYNQITNREDLQIKRKDKKLSFVSVDFTSLDEQFSKAFVEALMNETYTFYKETKTAQSRQNIALMQQKADSVKLLYEVAMYKGAAVSIVNINPALQTAAVPRLKQESDAKLYGTVYTEILKNLETLKLDMARETPIVQIIDKPIYPLTKDKFGKLKGVVFGGIIGGIIIILYLITILYLSELGILKSKNLI